MRKAINIFNGDRTIWIIYIFLSIVSFLAVYTSIGFTANQIMHRSPLSATLRHLMFIAAGYLIVWLGGKTNYRFYARISRSAFIISLVLLAIVLFVVKDRWLRIPIIGSVQPSEIAKICLIFLLATILSQAYSE